MAGRWILLSLANEAAQRRSYGTALLSRGLVVAARDEFLQWLAAVEETEDPTLVIPPLNALARTSVLRGELDGALVYLTRALHLADQPNCSASDRIRVLLNLIRVQTDIGQLDSALGNVHRVAELPVEQEAVVSSNYWLQVSALHWRRQEWVLMRQSAAKAYQRAVVANHQAVRAKALFNQGLAHLELGVHRLAERDLTAALRLHEEVDRSSMSYAYSEIGRLHFLRGEYKVALEAGREALKMLVTDVALLDREEVARLSRLFGLIFAEYGQRNLALKYLNRAAAYFSQLGLILEWQRSTEQIGHLLGSTIRPSGHQVVPEIQQLDFLTAVLDLTDDMESVEPYLRGHSERVTSLTVLLGESLGLAEEELKNLNYAARLHDVGMVAVDAELIRRDGPISETERRRIAMHTTIGEEMLRPHGLSEEGLRGVRHHHERYDGNGYPDGLSGEEIPLLARIIAVVDVYDALTSTRSYRAALSHREALEELQRMAGSELDPHLVDRFVRLYHIS
jgi:HD-GYP domain-containing protein (c-di-GMP phosphodiesterase class II)